MKNLLVVIAASVLLSACASSTKIAQQITNNGSMPIYYTNIDIKNNGTTAPDHFMVAVKSYLKQQLVSQEIFSEQKGNQIEITVTDYRMRSGFSRAMFGVFAGKDGVDSVVVITNTKTGEVTLSASCFCLSLIGHGNRPVYHPETDGP